MSDKTEKISGDNGSALAQQVAGFEAQFYHRQVDRMVDQLRRLADAIEREGHRVTNSINSPRFGWAAHNVVYSLMLGLANANVDAVVDAAARADAAHFEAQRPEASGG